jgi:hypothetical protein
MDLAKLKKQIPYRWRIQSINKQGTKASAVAYIDARDVMEVLDEVVGPENWQDRYSTEGDLLIAGIGIKTGGEWVWKHDTGSKTFVEEEKGQISDAFKRAAVKWGIGRFLYEIDTQWVSINKDKKPVDEKGQVIWDLSAYLNTKLSQRVRSVQ